MTTDSLELLGPRKYGLLVAVEALPPPLVKDLGLLDPKDKFETMDLEDSLGYQDEVANKLEPITQPFWQDPRIQFMVACGRRVYSSRTPFTEFDVFGFEQTMPHFATVLADSRLVPPLAPVVSLFTPKR